MRNLRPQNGAHAAPAAERGAFVAAIVGARRLVSITVPRTEVTGSLRLLTRAETRAVRAEARRHVEAEFGLSGATVEGAREFLEELCTRTIALAVRDPNNPDVPLADLGAWEECDDDQIGALWERYQDFEAELDPIGSAALTDEEFNAIRDAAKKKDETLLRSYGSRKLARYATTSVEPPVS